MGTDDDTWDEREVLSEDGDEEEDRATSVGDDEASDRETWGANTDRYLAVSDDVADMAADACEAWSAVGNAGEAGAGGVDRDGGSEDDSDLGVVADVGGEELGEEEDDCVEGEDVELAVEEDKSETEGKVEDCSVSWRPTTALRVGLSAARRC